jgi:hypothetical protein
MSIYFPLSYFSGASNFYSLSCISLFIATIAIGAILLSRKPERLIFAVFRAVSVLRISLMLSASLNWISSF